jgi:hypothetical protein
MRTITAILEADEDGTLHLPVPAELRQGKIEVTATLIPISARAYARPQFGCLAGKIHLAPDFDDPLGDFKEYME